MSTRNLHSSLVFELLGHYWSWAYYAFPFSTTPRGNKYDKTVSAETRAAITVWNTDVDSKKVEQAAQRETLVGLHKAHAHKTKQNWKAYRKALKSAIREEALK